MVRFAAVVLGLALVVGCGVSRSSPETLEEVVARHESSGVRVAWVARSETQVVASASLEEDTAVAVGSVAKLLILLFMDSFAPRDMEQLSDLMRVPACDGSPRIAPPTAAEVALHRGGIHHPPGASEPCFDGRLRGIRLYSNDGYVILGRALAPPGSLAMWLMQSLTRIGLQDAGWDAAPQSIMGVSGTTATAEALLDLGLVLAERKLAERGLIAQYLDDLRETVRVDEMRVDAYWITGSEDHGSAELWVIPEREEVLVLQSRGRYAPEVFDELRAAAFRQLGWELMPSDVPPLPLVAGRYGALDTSREELVLGHSENGWTIQFASGASFALRSLRDTAWVIESSDLQRLENAPGLVWEPFGNDGTTRGLRSDERLYLLMSPDAPGSR